MSLRSRLIGSAVCRIRSSRSSLVRITERNDQGMRICRMENSRMSIELAPELGGRVTCLIDRLSGENLLWTHPSLPLRQSSPGAEYEPVFWGGIDEILPND